MPAARYRIASFGTIYLTQAQRQSVSLIVGVEILNARLDYYESGKRLPPQGIWAYITRRWQDFVDGPELEVRFRKQRHVLWSDGTTRSDVNLCSQFAVSDLAILTELAKKPNIPPLPPSVPPTQPLLGRAPRSILERPGSISVKSVYESDMDVYVWWDGLPDDGSGPCQPLPIADPPIPPVAPALPVPTGAWSGPSVSAPAILPQGSPPIGGTSLNQGGSFPGDQSIPPSLLTQTFLRARIQIADVQEPCGAGQVLIQEWGPFPGILPQSALQLVNLQASGQGTFPCGATRYTYGWQGPNGPLTDSQFNLINANEPPQVIAPRYA